MDSSNDSNGTSKEAVTKANVPEDHVEITVSQETDSAHNATVLEEPSQNETTSPKETTTDPTLSNEAIPANQTSLKETSPDKPLQKEGTPPNQTLLKKATPDKPLPKESNPPDSILKEGTIDKTLVKKGTPPNQASLKEDTTPNQILLEKTTSNLPLQREASSNQVSSRETTLEQVVQTATDKAFQAPPGRTSQVEIQEETTVEGNTKKDDLEKNTAPVVKVLEPQNTTKDNISTKSSGDVEKDDSDISVVKQVFHTPKESSTIPRKVSLLPGKDASFCMQMGKEEIERMISDGTLEKVSEGLYKMKVESLKDIKVPIKNAPADGSGSSFKKFTKPTILQRKNLGKKDSEKDSIKLGNISSASSVPQTLPVSQVISSNFAQPHSFFTLPQSIKDSGQPGSSSSQLGKIANTMSIPQPLQVPQMIGSNFVQQAPSYIALMPVSQVAATNTTTNSRSSNNPILAVPIQQNLSVPNTTSSKNSVLAMPIQQSRPVSNASNSNNPVIAMPIQQNIPVSNTSSSTNSVLTMPIQQNLPVSYNPNLPTFIALPKSSIPNSAPPSQLIPAPDSSISSSTGLPNQFPNVPTEGNIQPQEDSKKSANPQPSTSSLTLRSSTQTSLTLRSSTQKSKALASDAKINIKTSTDTSNSPVTTGTKRKAKFETTKTRKVFQYEKPTSAKRQKTLKKTKPTVSDVNSSEEEENEDADSKVFGQELAAMFFKKAGESPKKNKSLMDKLHNSIFPDSISESEDDPVSSDDDDAVSDVMSGKCNYRKINCPGPGKFEAYVGPGKNSKLSVVQCQEMKTIKNFLYEVYQVKVTSSGREANTNILIPVPEGYKFQTPNQGEIPRPIELTHVPHENPQSANHVRPEFLKKLTATELKLRKYKDEVKVLRRRYLELLQEYANRPQFSTLSDLVGASAKFLTEDQLVFFLMQLKGGAHNMQGIRYSVREKVLALSIYQKSPEVYKWFRKLFNLPSKRLLDQWLEDIAMQDPQLVKKLMYHIYTTYNFKATT